MSSEQHIEIEKGKDPEMEALRAIVFALAPYDLATRRRLMELARRDG